MAQTIAAPAPAAGLSSRLTRYRRPALWSAAATVSFLFFLYATFPYDAVKSRMIAEASSAGWIITMESLGPGLFGVTAHGVKLRKAGEGSSDVPLELSSVALRPALFPPGIAVRADAFGGRILGSVGGLGDLSVNLALQDLDSSAGNLKAFSGMDLAGKLNGELALSLPKVEASKNGPREYDLGTASGTLTLDTDKLVVKGGNITVPMYGTPTPLDLPRIALGALDLHAKIDKGLMTFDRFKGKSEDLELGGGGTVKLERKPEFSALNLELKLKADPAFVKRLGMIGAGLSVLPLDPKDPGFRTARVTGMLGRPQFQQR